MKQNDYIIIQAPMVTELGLSGNRLIVYALIHGFCKDGVHEFHGSINYICEWTNLTRNTVMAVLKSLVDDELVTKREYTEHNVKFCAYQIRGSAKIAPLVQKFDGGSAKIAPHNINNNNIECKDISIEFEFIDDNNRANIEKEKNTKKEKENSELFEQCWVAYNRKGSKKKSKDQWNKLTDKEKERVLSHIKVYVATREKNFQRDFERYLRDKVFNDIIIQNNTMIYDPIDLTNNSYHPITGGALNWNDYYKCYLYTSWYFDGDGIADGYDDDKRPDGAQIMLNNGRGTLTWNKEQKKWIKK